MMAKYWKPIECDTDEEMARDINAEQIGQLAEENETLKAEVARLEQDASFGRKMLDAISAICDPEVVAADDPFDGYIAAYERLKRERDEAREAAGTIMLDWAGEEDYSRLFGLWPWLNDGSL